MIYVYITLKTKKSNPNWISMGGVDVKVAVPLLVRSARDGRSASERGSLSVCVGEGGLKNQNIMKRRGARRRGARRRAGDEEEIGQ